MFGNFIIDCLKEVPIFSKKKVNEEDRLYFQVLDSPTKDSEKAVMYHGKKKVSYWWHLAVLVGCPPKSKEVDRNIRKEITL